MKTTLLSLALGSIFAVFPAIGQEGGEVLTNADVITLAEAGVPDSIIVAKVEGSRTDFDLSVGGLVALTKAGVGEAVLAAMTKAAPSAAAAGGGRAAEPPSAAPASRRPGDVLSDPLSSGGTGPEMVVIPAGSFRMGCVSGVECYDDEKPVHQVTIPQSFAVSKYEITFEDYDRFTMPTGRVDDRGWGRGRRPVITVSWQDARDYVRWLSEQTGAEYRLLSEAEWEYAARAGTGTAYSWGNEIGSGRANCNGCGSQWDDEQTAPVGSFSPNAFGLHDMHGNVWEWVEDCWNESYSGAPSNGGAWTSGNCSRRVLRGGSWSLRPRALRSASRFRLSTGYRYYNYGFRVARTLTP